MIESYAMTRSLDRLLAIMARLRDPERGCPWDRVQDFSTIAPYTIEEAYEVADAIARGDQTALKDELGDLLFQVVFHARMAEEARLFAFEDVAAAIADKMLRRHPHVFGNAEIASAAAQSEAWEEHKAGRAAGPRASGRSAGKRPRRGCPRPARAAARAAKIQRRAARIGFDWPDAEPVIEKVLEEIAELKDRDRAGCRSAPRWKRSWATSSSPSPISPASSRSIRKQRCAGRRRSSSAAFAASRLLAAERGIGARSRRARCAVCSEVKRDECEIKARRIAIAHSASHPWRHRASSAAESGR